MNNSTEFKANKKSIIVPVIILLVLMLAGLFYVVFNAQEDKTTERGSGQSVTQDKTDLVEIFYLSHAPAKAIIQQIEPIIAKYPQYTVEKYDFEDPANDQLIEGYGIVNHLPIAIYINGINTFTVEEELITLENFPEGDAFVPSAEGDWSYEDLEKILSTADDQTDD